METIHRRFAGASFVIAPILFGASTFFWQNGEYGVIGGTLIALSMVFWIPVFYALFGILKTEMPYYYAIGLLLAIYGCCIGGAGFGFLAYFTAIFNIPHETYISTLKEYPLSANLLLFWPGPLFPLSLLVLSINLIRKRAIAVWLGLFLALGALTFPASRISKIEEIAHLADFFIAIPMIVLGYRQLKDMRSVRYKAETVRS